ncbi:Dopey, N-terminal-domain-containing protein [Amylocystis lapponica]|nr:Dopey, N-terminal-domain-containing protein [Amylocystis lapponica]
MFRVSPWITYDPSADARTEPLIRSNTHFYNMNEDVEMDAPQISTLREEETPEPAPARTSKFRVKLLVNEGKRAGSLTGPSLHKQTPAESDDEDEEDEDEEDQLIDDDDDDSVKWSAPPAIPVPEPHVPASTRGSPTKRGQGRGRGGGRRRGRGAASNSAAVAPTFEVAPSEAAATTGQGSVSEVWDPATATTSAIPAVLPPPRKRAPAKGATAQRAIRKKTTNEDATLEGVPIPIYPLPSKPFPVQPPVKIAGGIAPTVTVDRSGKPVRRWRQVNREVRGIAGGRWFTRTWVGEKESEFASVAAAVQQTNADRESISAAGALAAGVAIPRLPVLMSGSASGKHAKSKAAKADAGISTGGPSRAASTPPAYASDPKYKKYTQQVERCLSSFDSVHEWADFISFLKQLLKTFQSYMQFKEIPRKLVVSKRLSQCLNPALPTGVHQRALDVYSHILAVLGVCTLKFSPQILVTEITVKPTVLNLFDTHYLPLQAGLRPIMKSFILALLPGLEEETGEYFDKVRPLTFTLCSSVIYPPSFFFQNIWLAMLTTPSARGTSLNFLSRRLPSPKAEEDITSVVGHDIGLMIRAFSAALEDDDLLVRRSALDLLLQSLRIDSVAVKQAQHEDRIILMRAATSVVLRRDLSLNRRLYSWLLGPDENSQHQMEYLKLHALELLKETLRDEMFHPSAEYSQSRPFKIFISLLDKWEIGSPLTEVLIFDAFKAIKRAVDTGTDSGDDVSMTASTLYEAVEPHVLWKQLFSIVLSDLNSSGERYEGYAMVRYLLATFHAQDEEIENVHLPIGFAAIMELLTVRQISAYPCFRLSLDLSSRPNLTAQPSSAVEELGPLSFACKFYGIEGEFAHRTRTSPNIPFVAVFEDLVDISTLAAQGTLAEVCGSVREVFALSLALLKSLVSRLGHMRSAPFVVTWDPDEWLSVLLPCLDHKTTAFVTVDHIVTTVIQLQQVSQLEPQFYIDDRATISTMVNTLLKYLRLPYAAYHMRTVTLIWSLESISRSPHVESVIAQNLSSRNSQAVQDACEAFGVLWRLTDDNLAPGFHLKVPMMTVLDTLKSEDPSLRRIGETWMRCSLKSYLRVLDPIIFDLFDPSIRRSPFTVELHGKQLQGFDYDRPFDQRYANHLLETLLSIVKFGGQGFSKIARTTAINRSPYVGLLQRLQSVSLSFPDASYLDVVLHLLLRFLQSEPKPPLVSTMHTFNISSQSVSVDLLQAIIARGEVDFPALQTIESAVVKKLYFCVHTGRLDLQNKLLHLLHSIISASNPGTMNRISDGMTPLDGPQSSKSDQYNINPLLIQTLIDGISVPENRPVLQHWLDFILMTLPQFIDTMQAAVAPLSDTVCRQLRTALADIRHVSASSQQTGDLVSYTTDADFMMLLTAVERLALLSLSHVLDANQVEDDATIGDKPSQESVGLLGYVSNVFSSDYASTGVDDQSMQRSSDSRCLHETVRVLYAIWETLAGPSHHLGTSQEESLSLIHARTKTRCRRVLEHLFRAHSTEVIESIVDFQVFIEPKPEEGAAAFEIVDALTSSAQTVVHMLCESISSRTPGLSERTKKQAAIMSLTDMILFDFLEQYIGRLEGPLALQVWARFMQLVKDLVASLKEFKAQAFSALRCFTVLADKVTQTTAIEDRRLRKELQETYGKLLDICVLAGRSFDQGSWIRRSQKDTLNTNGRDSPTPRDSRLLTPDTKLDEKPNASTISLPDSIKPTYNPDLIDQVNRFIASDVLPNLRKFLMEGDKILSACSNIIYNIVAPAMKGKTRPMDVEDIILSIIQEMTRIGVAVKAWRGPITDVLNDNRCFNSTPVSGGKWRPMVKSLFDTDKTSLTELLGKITTAPSANIFTNREYEMLLRSLNLRRLSYALLSGEKNHFLTHLPIIQEKLVDTLRNVSAPIVQSEVYLCVRVLLCRLSPHNLSSFWPVILTELYRLFDQTLANLPSDGSEDLSVILSACKLLDLLLVLQTEEFQVHQWIFITDTVDAVYRPDNWFPEAMLDRLAEVTSELPVGENGAHAPQTAAATPGLETRPMRRPMLGMLRQIDSIRDLVPFFSGASIISYESVYSSGGIIDWEAVERGLLEDMFDGR